MDNSSKFTSKAFKENNRPSQGKSWAEIREEVRNVRRKLWGLGYRLPHSFACRDLKKHEPKTRIYFMSAPPNCKENSVYAVDIPKYAPPQLQIKSKSISNIIYPWIQIISSGFQSNVPLSREEQLQVERRRMAPGIATFDFNPHSAKFVFSSANSLFQCIDIIDDYVPSAERARLNAVEISTKLNKESKLNAKMCPYDTNLIAYVSNGDIYVVNTEIGIEMQATNTAIIRSTSGPISAGYPSYIMQEEFNRFIGFWWQPIEHEAGVYRILYEEIDESDVSVVTLISFPGSPAESYRFPRSGSPNAKSRLRFIEFAIREGKFICLPPYDFPFPFSSFFPWAEYIVRAGWTPKAEYVWVQLLDRKQQRLDLVLFTPPAMKLTISCSLSQFAYYTNAKAPAFVIFSEKSEVWINVHDILEFFPLCVPNEVEFIWASEESGFRHLYYVKSLLRPPICSDVNSYITESIPPPLHLSPYYLEKRAVTEGDWEVVNCPISLSVPLGVIFFTALMDTPLERHIYAVSFLSKERPHRLTKTGYYYSAVIDLNSSLVILTSSSLASPHLVQVCRIVVSQEKSTSISSKISFLTITHIHETASTEAIITTPEMRSYVIESGETLFAMIYKPLHFDSKKKYPVVLNIYGGPEVQMVFNSYKGSSQLWLYLLASQGYGVVIIDSRGSHHRGVAFEGHIRQKLGSIELQDQVEVLKSISSEESWLDMSRIGIHGWSYGGYLSLMALAHYPDIFKVAVSGAPVTSWELYDTGYTERYMGTPSENQNAYNKSSVLSYIQQFPDEENRLLIIHGLLDENVHFIHSANLVSQLISTGKPHILQIYPNERHSLRRLDSSEHYETLLLSFILRYL